MRLPSLPLLLSLATVAECEHQMRSGGPNRRLTIQRIVGFLPRTQVTDHAALDLDQKSMEEELFLEKLIKARNVYEKGGHSRSFAVLTLTAPTGPNSLKQGEEVVGTAEAGGKVTGRIMQDISWAEGNTQNIEIRVQYTTSDVQAKYVGCQVGGLYTFKEANRDGCFADTGSVVIARKGESAASNNVSRKFSYSYNSRMHNNNGRTLQMLSNTAHNTMMIDGNYIPDYQLFLDYYGNTNYADKWFLNAEQHTALTFESGKGDADFTRFHTKQALAEVMAKSTVTMHLFMYVIRQLEDAVSQCHKQCDQCQQNALRALDEAVALYAGSLEGEHGTGDGKFFYDFANERALNFRTAGDNGNDDEGTAFVNLAIVREFKKMQIYILENQCANIDAAKEAVVNYMKVPLVQGVLRYAYIREFQGSQIPENAEKEVAQGATYAAALLPFVHKCHASDAHVIYSNMKVAPFATKTSFKDVKHALEKNYKCMGIKCTDVGGIWTVNGYATGADPCGAAVPIASSPASSSSAPNNSGGADMSLAQLHPGVQEGGPGAHAGTIAGAVIGVVAALALIALGLGKYTKAQQYGVEEFPRPKHADLQRNNNIAAVAEINLT